MLVLGEVWESFLLLFFLDNILIYELLTQMTTIHSSVSARSLANKSN